jgi:hypothetical protein
MKPSEFIDNQVRDYPLWSLILGSVVMILLAIGHVIRYKQSSKKLHHCFAFSLICLSVQYICATQDINTAYLTMLVDLISSSLNTLLFCIWAASMENYLIDLTLFICFISFMYNSALGLAIFITSLHLSLSVTKDTIIMAWQTALIISIVGSGILTLVTLLYQCCLNSEEYKDKNKNDFNLLIYLYYRHCYQ